jgi:7-keto-8-aminopelargonate synthetase-like enzyme
MPNLVTVLEETIGSRRERGLLRSLAYDKSPLTNEKIDFSSNDYLGFARSEELEDLTYSMLDELRREKKNQTMPEGRVSIAADRT